MSNKLTMETKADTVEYREIILDARGSFFVSFSWQKL